ncbi:hypothetical protein [Nostoc flagelliforme]|uniref:hypothetical protein n=1 Tax=Nostoc flagelliforme TaxID=1306274 RepID=UPI0012FD1C4E|nr:hypothetical protein [Nostoc flagelliforme]
MTQSAASNLLLQVGDCHERILLPPTDANAEVMEIPSTGSEKGDCIPREKQSPLNRNLDNRNHHGILQYDYHTFCSTDSVGRVS